MMPNTMNAIAPNKDLCKPKRSAPKIKAAGISITPKPIFEGKALVANKM